MSDNRQIPNEFQSPVKSKQYTSELPDGWHKPKPEVLPKPGYWPFLLALGIAFILWGLAVGFNEVFSTIIIVSGLGLILFIVALAGWIGDLRDERKHENE
jgi:uncharacterized membrane protein HdeD (DUF308 family)